LRAAILTRIFAPLVTQPAQPSPQVRVILDGAHNGDAVAKLLAQVQSRHPTRRLAVLFGANTDKELSSMVLPVANAADTVIFASSSHPLAAPSTTLKVSQRYINLGIDLGGSISGFFCEGFLCVALSWLCLQLSAAPLMCTSDRHSRGQALLRCPPPLPSKKASSASKHFRALRTARCFSFAAPATSSQKPARD
jgi:hypothetical protein